jgi:site-specific DNA-methyltransferase (adenine-specific)
MNDNTIKVLFSSKDQSHATPQDFFDKIDKEFNFDLDVCATSQSAKCSKFFTKEDDAFKQDWVGNCWMNPPYGREIIHWMKKAWEEHQKHGNTIVCLVPARTDTNWWHNYVEGKAKVRFIKGRLKFGNATNSAPFPSVLVIYQK